MSKLKLSFSLLLAFLIVGILSTNAFARNAMDVKGTENPDKTFGISISKYGAPEGNNLVVKLTTVENGQEVVVETKDVNFAAVKPQYTTPVLTPGKVYTVSVSYKDEPNASLGVVGITNISVDNKANSTNNEIVVDHDTDFINANNTGLNSYSKKRSGQSMHGSYQSNTNSCASCHQTHTGKDHFLLFRDGTYSTCAACHDGTMGAKGVFAAPSEGAGTFGGTHAGNMSVHLTDGSVKVSAAPGGNYKYNAATDKGNWDADFSCGSCHNPHGSESAALLLADPAGMIQQENVITAGKSNGGMMFTKRDVYEKAFIPTTNVGDYILVRQTLTTLAERDANTFFKKANVPVGSTVISTYKWNAKQNKNAGGYIPDSSQWIVSNNSHSAPVNSKLFIGDTAVTPSATFVFVNKDGFAYSTDAAAKNVTTGTYLIGSSVDHVASMDGYFDSNSLNYVKDSGVQMSQFCASCHTDYLSSTYGVETGVYSIAHRHQTDTDRLTCVRCHYAHGTDATIMKDSLDRGITELKAAGMTDQAAFDYLKDPNPSSALKRYTGMSVCFGCHDGSIANDTTTWSNYSPKQPGIK